MESTPKLQRKSSLSLSSRLNKKRHSGSPQSLVITNGGNGVLKGRDYNSNNEVPRSPSVYSVCSDVGIECTPPHKKSTMSLGDIGDGDYSPKVFDTSFSPSCFLSQTMAIDSPEVGWKWKRHTNGKEEDASTRTPDSAYAADSSLTSHGSSSTELTKARARSDNYHKRIANDARKEQELRRVAKTQADEKLKQRCAKLQEQLRIAGEAQRQKILTSQSNGCSTDTSGTSTSTSTSGTTSMGIKMTSLELEPSAKKQTPTGICAETLNDFFNDSDEDCFLLAATQEIESKIDANHQVVARPPLALTTNSKAECEPVNTNLNSSISSTTNVEKCTPPNTKEKRSSFYMKFLEDDCTDDWFISLDEVILQATQSKKPRTSLQRYKSMPTNSNEGSKVDSVNAATKSDSMLNGSTSSFVESPVSSTRSYSKMKRHSSSHALSPVSSNYRNRQNHLKK